jgi:hypothetical protein
MVTRPRQRAARAVGLRRRDPLANEPVRSRSESVADTAGNPQFSERAVWVSPPRLPIAISTPTRSCIAALPTTLPRCTSSRSRRAGRGSTSTRGCGTRLARPPAPSTGRDRSRPVLLRPNRSRLFDVAERADLGRCRGTRGRAVRGPAVDRSCVRTDHRSVARSCCGS